MKALLFLMILLSALPGSKLSSSERADYIVVGLGTAGAAMAKLLSDDMATSVIGIHNGKNLTQDPDIKYTRNAFFTVISALFGSSFYQTGFTIPQVNDDNKELFWAMGLPEGGASSINAGAWALGTNQVYAQWEAVAGPEWSTSVIANLYKGLENYHGLTPDPNARGFSGPLEVRQIPVPTPFSIKFSQAAAAATGFPLVLDYNDPNTPIGVSPQMQYTQSGADGRLRVSSATAFLNKSVVNAKGEGAGDRKLQLKLKSTALKTIWKGNKAIGVKYYHNGKIKKAYARKGVVICCGLYSSAFLMHSGVGPKNLLASFDIPVKFDNPHVGQALADQTLLNVAFLANPNDTPIAPSSDSGLSSRLSFNLNTGFLFAPSFLNLADRKRVLNTVLKEGFAFPENSIFSQISWLPAPGGDPTIRRARITTVNPIPGLGLGLIDLVQPLSRGQIVIKSSNPFDAPVIDSGMFNNQADLALYVQVFQTYVKNIFATLQAMDSNYQLFFPPIEVINDTNLLTAFIKEAVMSNQCWQSHCRMAPFSQGGVVDSTGAVYGVENLYVADNSINPVPMDGTPMATGYLTAANIARLLLQQ